MTVTGAHIVARAMRHNGVQEVPLGSNRGPFVQSCQEATFLAGTGWPWCAAFVCKVAAECGVPLAYNGAGAHDLADHHDTRPWRLVRPGDVVDYNEGSGHTGIVTEIDLMNGVLRSVDGNWNDRVTEHAMPLRAVRKFWRIPGVDNHLEHKPVKHRKPVFRVVTGASGHRVLVFRHATKRRITRWLSNHLGRLNNVTIIRAKRS